MPQTALQHWTRSAPGRGGPLRPTNLPIAEAKADLGPRPTTADLATAFANPFLCGIDRGLGHSQALATCVPSSVSLCVLGTSPDPVCSQVASGLTIQASVSSLQKQMLSVLTLCSSYRLGQAPCCSPSLATGPLPQLATHSLTGSAWGPLTH